MILQNSSGLKITCYESHEREREREREMVLERESERDVFENGKAGEDKKICISSIVTRRRDMRVSNQVHLFLY